MQKLVSVYNRCFRSLNSSGPNDPTATVFLVGDGDAYPQTLCDADAVRFLATQQGGIIYALPHVRQSISDDGATIKAALLVQMLLNCHIGSVEELTRQLKREIFRIDGGR